MPQLVPPSKRRKKPQETTSDIESDIRDINRRRAESFRISAGESIPARNPNASPTENVIAGQHIPEAAGQIRDFQQRIKNRGSVPPAEGDPGRIAAASVAFEQNEGLVPGSFKPADNTASNPNTLGPLTSRDIENNPQLTESQKDFLKRRDANLRKNAEKHASEAEARRKILQEQQTNLIIQDKAEKAGRDPNAALSRLGRDGRTQTPPLSPSDQLKLAQAQKTQSEAAILQQPPPATTEQLKAEQNRIDQLSKLGAEFQNIKAGDTQGIQLIRDKMTALGIDPTNIPNEQLFTFYTQELGKARIRVSGISAPQTPPLPPFVPTGDPETDQILGGIGSIKTPPTGPTTSNNISPLPTSGRNAISSSSITPPDPFARRGGRKPPLSSFVSESGKIGPGDRLAYDPQTGVFVIRHSDGRPDEIAKRQPFE